MALGQNATKESLATAFTGLGNWIAVYTNVSAGTEATGGSPAYARKQTTWSGGASDGVATGSQVAIDLPAGTYDGVGIYTASTGGTLIEKVSITSTTLGAQGQILVTPTVTIT